MFLYFSILLYSYVCSMLKKLRLYRGYTVDTRLKEFRKVHRGKNSELIIEFVPFSSAKGKKLLLGLGNQIS